MSSTLVLDTGPLGLVTNPRRSGENNACYEWLERQVSLGSVVVVPEIADYEVRRELIRAGKLLGIQRLDTIVGTLEYVPITTPAMRLAARLWAETRQAGAPTASPDSIDGDVILAAQVLTADFDDAVVVTTNVGHLVRFVTAKTWCLPRSVAEKSGLFLSDRGGYPDRGVEHCACPLDVTG